MKLREYALVAMAGLFGAWVGVSTVDHAFEPEQITPIVQLTDEMRTNQYLEKRKKEYNVSVMAILRGYREIPDDNYTLKQQYCLAQNVYFEARNQSREGQIAVIAVTLNRVISRKYPNTICEVTTQRKLVKGKYIAQFSWYSDGKSDVPKELILWERIQVLSASVLENYVWIEDPTYGALWYHTTSVDPYWNKSMKKVVQIEDHIFYAKQ